MWCVWMPLVSSQSPFTISSVGTSDMAPAQPSPPRSRLQSQRSHRWSRGPRALVPLGRHGHCWDGGFKALIQTHPGIGQRFWSTESRSWLNENMPNFGASQDVGKLLSLARSHSWVYPNFWVARVISFWPFTIQFYWSHPHSCWLFLLISAREICSLPNSISAPPIGMVRLNPILPFGWWFGWWNP